MFWFENILCLTRLSLLTFYSTVTLEYRKRVFRKKVAHTRSHCYAVDVSTIITVYCVRTLFVLIILQFSLTSFWFLFCIIRQTRSREEGIGQYLIRLEWEIIKIIRDLGRKAQGTFCCSESGYHDITAIKKTIVSLLPLVRKKWLVCLPLWITYIGMGPRSSIMCAMWSSSLL